HILFNFFLLCATPPDISSLSLHDALPISASRRRDARRLRAPARARAGAVPAPGHRAHPHPRRLHVARAAPRAARSGNRAAAPRRSEEHTSELQSRENLVCRLLLEKKKKYN